MDDNNSIIVNIPAPRIFAKTSAIETKPSHLKRILKRVLENRNMKKHSDTSMRKYTLPANKPLELKVMQRPEFLLPYKIYSKIERSEKHKYKMNICLQDKYKVISTDLRNRLYSEDPCDDVHAITDIDKSFYNYVNGRAIRDRAPVFKSLMSMLSDQLRLKQEIGYRCDGVLNIDANLRRELEINEISYQMFAEQAKCFDYFVSEDYNKSMALLSKWDMLKGEVNKKIVELENLATEQFTIKSRLMSLDYLYGLQQKYGRFLYYISPSIWRSKNREFARSVEIEQKGFDLGCSEEDTFTVVFEKMKKECLGKLVKPVLYFTHPIDLMDIFEVIEKQQLHHFMHVTHLAPLKKTVSEEAKILKDLLLKESSVFVTTIKSYETLLEFYDEREKQLKTKFFKILNGVFYESIGTPEVLTLFLHLEFCYEKVYSEKPLSMDGVSIARSLEIMFMDYSKKFDAVHNDTIKKSVHNYFQMERTKFKKARIASRELRYFDRLEKDLLTAFKPPPDKSRNRNAFENGTKRVSEKPHKTPHNRKYSKHSTSKSTHYNLSESEIEYLTLFTDWTENENPANYLHLD